MVLFAFALVFAFLLIIQYSADLLESRHWYVTVTWACSVPYVEPFATRKSQLSAISKFLGFHSFSFFQVLDGATRRTAVALRDYRVLSTIGLRPIVHSWHFPGTSSSATCAAETCCSRVTVRLASANALEN
jgi:hypothetical protein